jgi:recombination protein RecA
MFGNPETTTGGKALKFYASIRMEVRRTGQIKEADNVTGSQTKVKVVKNKIAPPFRTAEFDIMYNEGISQAGSTLDVAAELGIIQKAGSWFSYGDEKIAQGRESAKQYLNEHPKIMAEVNAKIRDYNKEVPFEIGREADEDGATDMGPDGTLDVEV